jgi:DNA-binding transcriptional LysR family regulator
MLQRFFAALRANYGVTVFFLYLGAFAVAFVGTFTLPLLAIGMVLLAIFLLVPAVLLGDLIGALSRWANRPYIRRGECPRCREQQGPAWEPPVYRCAFCSAAWLPDGDPEDGPSAVPAEPALSSPSNDAR